MDRVGSADEMVVRDICFPGKCLQGVSYPLAVVDMRVRSSNLESLVVLIAEFLRL